MKDYVPLCHDGYVTLQSIVLMMRECNVLLKTNRKNTN